MRIRRIQWDHDAWEDYCIWQQTNKAILKRINQLVKDISRDPYSGIGKPEPLKGNLRGFWSRRIDEENRIIYAVEFETVLIIACKSHYD